MIRRERRSNDALHKLCRNKTAVAGFLVVCIMVIFAVFAPWIATHDPYALSMANSKLPPGVDGHIFGTDELGRDLFSRIVYGSRVSISVALGGTILGGILGSILGMIAGDNTALVESLQFSLRGGGQLMLGSFLNAVLNFIVMAFVVFCSMLSWPSELQISPSSRGRCADRWSC